jgi:acetylornithine deacetylase
MDPLPLLRDLVAADSVNPSLVPGAAGEGAAAEVCRAALARLGLDVVVQSVQPGRPNVIGMIEGRARGPSLMFCGHLDTVGVDGMVDPFVPRVEDGRLYGRGAQDMKSGIAAMVAAAAMLSSEWTRGRLIVAGVVDEEYESVGAEALVREWQADAAIVTEPTDLRLVVAHKGFAWIDIVTRGRAAHGSRPDDGRDAILRMGRVLGALERLDREVQGRTKIDLQGTGSLHASIINGGRELSSYPDRCELQMERRTVSGETGRTVLAEVEAILAQLKADDPEFEASATLATNRSSYALDRSHRLPTMMSAIIDGAGRSGEPAGMSFWTDAAILGDAGIPAVLFGPGGAGLHSLTEYVNLDSVYMCRDILVETARRWMEGAVRGAL